VHIQSASAPDATATIHTSAAHAEAAIPAKNAVIRTKSAPSAFRCDRAATAPSVPAVRFHPAALRTVVLTVARAVRSLALLASAAALVIAAFALADGLDQGDILSLLAAAAPPVVLWVLWGALRELAELPDRLRRLPQTARERHVDLQQLAGELRDPTGRLVRLPRTLWRLRVLAGTARDLVTPHAPLLPFVSVTFLTVSALAAVAALIEIGVALALLIGAVL
jgi:hypothetical protein